MDGIATDVRAGTRTKLAGCVDGELHCCHGGRTSVPEATRSPDRAGSNTWTGAVPNLSSDRRHNKGPSLLERALKGTG